MNDVIEKYNMLPDLKTIYTEYSIGEGWEILQFANRYIQFDIDTESGKMRLSGVFVQYIPNEDMRNMFDQLFIPMGNVNAFLKLEKEKASILEQLKLGHFINVGTATNIIRQQP